MSDHRSFVALASRLIPKNGRKVQIIDTSKVGPAYDPNTTKTTNTVIALQVAAKQSERDRGLVTETSRVYLVDSKVVIKKKMKLVDGKKLSITSVKHLQPGDQSILYRVIADG